MSDRVGIRCGAAVRLVHTCCCSISRCVQGRGVVWVVVLLALLCAFPAVATAAMSTGDGSWVWLAPRPQGNGLNDVCTLDGAHAWAVGSRGAILFSSDGGVTWTAQVSGTTKDLTSVSFASSSCGLAGGQDGLILQTTDGGGHWFRHMLPTTTWVNAVAMPTTLRGWATAGFTIYRTLDGGLTWASQGSSDAYLDDISFADGQHGIAVSDLASTMTTTDGGVHWTWRTWTAPKMSAVDMIDGAHAWGIVQGAYGGYGTISATTDGGGAWKTTAAIDEWVNDLSFADADHGIVVGIGGYIGWTSDGGETWTGSVTPTWGGMQGVDLWSPTSGVVVDGSGVILATGDGGASWTSPGGDPAWSVAIDLDFVDAGHGWAVGWRTTDGESTTGAIMATGDGGRTWVGQDPGVGASLSAVDFADQTNGWAVGGQGSITATTDGGATWLPQDAGTTADLHDVAFVDARRGWAVGTGFDSVLGRSAGRLIETTDAGTTWSPVWSVDGWTSQIRFVDALHGWISGGTYDAGSDSQVPALWRTSDGGASWTLVPSSGLTGGRMSWVDATTGWMLGDGTVLKSTDGGESWTPTGLDVSRTLRDVCFADAQHGWVIGYDSGTDVQTTWETRDGGDTWTPKDPGTTTGLYCLFALDAGHVYAGGFHGSVLARDLTPPRTTAPGADGSWHNQPASIDLVAADDLSDTIVTSWRLDGGAWQTGTPATVPAPADGSADGEHLLEFRSRDAAGNREPIRTATVGIDTTPPTASIGGVDETWSDHARLARFAGSDVTSGVARIQWRCNARRWRTGTSYLVPAADAILRLSVRVTDRAGNETVTGTLVRTDVSPPVVTVQPAATVGGVDVAVPCRVSDAVSAYAFVEVDVVGADGRVVLERTPGWRACNIGFTFGLGAGLRPGAYRVVVHAVDQAGHGDLEPGVASLTVR